MSHYKFSFCLEKISVARTTVEIRLVQERSPDSIVNARLSSVFGVEEHCKVTLPAQSWGAFFREVPCCVCRKISVASEGGKRVVCIDALTWVPEEGMLGGERNLKPMKLKGV